MSKGFNQKIKASVSINVSEIDNIIKKYKKLNKYKKSSLFALKTLDGTEKIISKLIEESQENL